MSVSSGLNRVTLICCAVAVALVAAALLVDRGGSTGASPGARAVSAATAPQAREASKALDVVAPATSVDVSRRLFASSPVAVLADPADPEAQRVAIATATSLAVPVLVDSPEAPAEISRLEAATVLTFGATQDVPGARPVTVDDASAAAEVARLGGDRAPDPLGTVVLTASAQDDAAAIATARAAGAQVVEVPGADPRTSDGAAAALAERPDEPVIALGAAFDDVAYPLAVVRTGAEQPTGGYLALGDRTYTAMYGHPGAPQLGVLGEQGVKASVARVERLARKYRRVSSSTFVPTFEIIATVASASAGKDKDYSTETSVAKLRPLVDAAEKAGVYVVLDLQPGRTDFLTQAKRYRSLLERPHVGLALDPEWRLMGKQKHLVQIGSVSAAEINRTSAWLADLTREKTLPQKVFVLHQFSLSMIKDRDVVDTSHPELATVIHVDGSGPQGAKQDTWRTLRRNAPKDVGWGWKNFVDEDAPMLDARQTWRQVRPHPDLITYQ
ncbi:hypothetical protein IFT73_16305 [Aeromicrobium sp. CFBP 8757]|uniref:hypothetical protein n=1 Tax=Aeromicrobium sp. CFBP 8757 TaxID=2775288 RepID=UPI001783B961|nr:hypothetical protein [Aeromicrobium sp. CFBP 8757]MBD8608419.1 hypothetical protein [Aeromicrobium sp. CFBP 8757]